MKASITLLQEIGSTTFECDSNNNVMFLCSPETIDEETRLLQNILNELGYEFTNDEEIPSLNSIGKHTNMSWKEWKEKMFQ